jgi:thioredoxin reductase
MAQGKICPERPLGIVLADDKRVKARTVVVASGARYRRPEVERLEMFRPGGSCARAYNARVLTKCADANPIAGVRLA